MGKRKFPTGALTTVKQVMDIADKGCVIYNIWMENTSTVRIRSAKLKLSFAGSLREEVGFVEVTDFLLEKSIKEIGRVDDNAHRSLFNDFYFSNYFHAYAFFIKMAKKYSISDAQFLNKE